LNARPAARSAAALAVLAAALLAAPESAVAKERDLHDPENPRNVRFEGRLVEWVAARPAGVAPSGSPPTWVEGAPVTWIAVLRDLLGTAEPEGPARFTVGGRPRGPVPVPDPVAVFEGVSRRGVPSRAAARWRAEPGRHAVEVRFGDDVLETTTDALRLLLLVERRTFSAGEDRFGSFVRRLRKSLDDLHALFRASVWPLAPRGVLDRFRLDQVALYDRRDGPPRALLDDPAFDVVVVCDEGGPAPATPSRRVVSHAFLGEAPHRGLWSSWGEQTLWRDLLRTRGVPDYAPYAVAEGALPGRLGGAMPLPRPHAADLAASARQTPAIGEVAAVVANARRGAGRVGDPEDPADRDGHVWSWLPARIDLALSRGGRPAAGATVRWWRARAEEGLLDGRTPGVARGRAPDGEAVADAAGRASVGGDYLGRSAPKGERSRWLLLEVESDGERRFEVLLGLDLNLAYARGHKYGWPRPVRFEDLRPAGTASPR
jgi:hypothetical protein